MPLMAKAAATRGGVGCEKSAPGTTPTAKKSRPAKPAGSAGRQVLNRMRAQGSRPTPDRPASDLPG